MDLKLAVDSELSRLPDSPTVTNVVDPLSSWYAEITLKDRNVLWRFIRERGFLTLVAAPESDPIDSFDFDLLWRWIFGGPAVVGPEPDVAKLISAMQLLREPVSRLFRPEQWVASRTALVQLGLQRNVEDPGKP